MMISTKFFKFLTSPTMGLPSPFFDKLLFNTIDSIDWKSFKSGNGANKNQKKSCRKNSPIYSRSRWQGWDKNYYSWINQDDFDGDSTNQEVLEETLNHKFCRIGWVTTALMETLY